MPGRDSSRPVAVTGAGGFVGQHLLSYLEDKADAVALTGDVRDAQHMTAQIKRFEPRALIHLAAIAAPSDAAADPAQAWAVNVLGTFSLAHVVRTHAPDCRFIFAGSSSVYGGSFRSAHPVAEDTPLEPLTPYAATKAAADLMIGQMGRDGLRSVRFRPFNHTGPGQSEAYAVAAFARQIVRIERGLQPPVIRTGNLDVDRDFLDVRDVVRAYASAALDQSDKGDGEAFNLATGQPVRIGYLLDTLVSLTDCAIAIEPDPKRMRPDELPVMSGDPSRAESALGWRAERPIRETLAETLDWWRELGDRAPEQLGEG